MADPTLVVRVAANLSEMKSNLAEGVDQIETYRSALSRAASAFDGSRIVQQASAAAAAIQNAGGVTTLTASELTKANALFTDAAAKLQMMGQGGTYAAQQFSALADSTKQVKEVSLDSIPVVGQLIAAFSVERILSFVEGAIEGAARLKDLEAATGISADGLQRLGYVGAEANLDLDQLSRGVEQFSTKLANGDGNATKAVQMLGLSVTDLVTAGPLDAFLQFTAAASTVADPMQKNALYVDAFGGRLGKLLASLGDVTGAMNSVPKDAIISQANIDRAKDFDTGLAHLAITAKAWTAQLLGGMVDLGVWLNGMAGTASATDKSSTALGANTKAIGDNADAGAKKQAGDVALISNAQLWQNELDKLAAKQSALTDVDVDQLAAENALGVSAKDLAEHYNLTESAVSSLLDAHKKYTAAVEEVNSAGQGWRGTLETLNGDVVEAIKYYLDAGVAQDKLATYFGVTASQVKAVATAMQTQIAQQAELTKANDDFYKAVNAASHDTVTAQVNDAYLAADARIAAMTKAKAYSIDAEMAIWAAANQTANNIIQKQLESDPYTKQHYQLLADQAKIAYDFALAHAEDYTNQEMQILAAAYRDNTQASMHWAAQASADMDAAAAKAKTTGAAVTTIGIAYDTMGNLLGKYAAQVKVTDEATVGWNASIMATHSEMDAVNMDITAQIRNVETLAGEYITAAQAQQRFDQGGSMAIPTVTVTSGNKSTLVAELQSIEAEYASLPGRAPGGSGPTGLTANDETGYDNMLAERVRYLSLKAALPGYLWGGPVHDTGPAIVHGGEYVVPKDGALVSGGGGGSQSVTFAPGSIVLQWPIMNDPRSMQAVVGMLGDGIMAKLRGAGLRVPSGV